jgi:hypothetical protein
MEIFLTRKKKVLLVTGENPSSAQRDPPSANSYSYRVVLICKLLSQIRYFMLKAKSIFFTAMLLMYGISPVWSQKKTPPASSTGNQKGAAAKVKVSWGDEYEIPRKHLTAAFIGNAKEGYIQVLTHGNKSMILKRFDGNLKSAGLGTINLEDMPRGWVNEGFVTLKKNVYFLFSSWDRENKRESIHARQVDLQNSSLGPIKDLLECNKIGGAGGFSFYGPGVRIGGYGTGKYTIMTSSDSSKLFITYMLKPEVKNDKKSFEIDGMFAFDDKLNKVNGDEFTMPYTEAMMDNEDYQVDKNGIIYMLAKVYEESRKESKDKRTPNYHYELFRYTKGNKNAEIIPFALDNGFTNSIVIMDDADGNLRCSGFYSKERNAATTGAFLLKLDAGTSKFSKFQKGYYDFPADVLKSFESARTQRKMEKKEEKGKLGASNLEFRNFHIHPDGSVTIVGEEYYSVTTYSTDSHGHTTQHTTYYYNDIMAMKIDPAGNIAWVKKIPKAQSGGAGMGGMSFKFFAKGDDIYLFYLDNAKNANIKLDQPPAHHSDGMGGILVCEKIDGKGKDSRTVLFDSKEIKQRIIPTSFSTVSTKQLLTTTSKKKTRTLLMLTVD